MKYVITSVKDKLVGFQTFELNQKEEIAIRTFSNMCSQSPQIINHPEDYSLYKLGEFDSDTGIIVSLDPVILKEAKEYVIKDDISNKI